MKIEFLVAFLDNTWDTQIVDVPNNWLSQWNGQVKAASDPEFDDKLNDWINANTEKFHGDIVLIAPYCLDPEGEILKGTGKIIRQMTLDM